ncbi:MAG: hypothetical protein OIF32_03470 [Campylobacterales bacterium]|nr:hypothetical protein [Campylobacterales bacterium]
MIDGYTIAQIIHLLCGIAFLGFIFADVFILPVLKTKYDPKQTQEIKQTISDRGRKVFPITVLIIVLSGGFMMSRYINSDLGVFNTSLQQLLMIKIILAFFIVSGIIFSLTRRAMGKQPHPKMKYFHSFVFILGVIIVLLAKVMFVV